MYCIGLTGTIASGKSTVADYFRQLGIDVISADEIAHQLTQKKSPILADIAQYFSPHVFSESGELNRRQLREIILQDPKAKSWLEQLLHPLIRKEIQQQVNACQSSYCVIEIPLLTNREDYPYLNRILLVEADTNVQIDRLIERDHCTAAQAQLFLQTHAENNTRAQLADDFIQNTGTKAELLEKVKKMHEEYLGLATEQD